MLPPLLFSLLCSPAPPLARGDTIETQGRVFYYSLDAKKPSFLVHGRREEKDGSITISSTYTDLEGKPLAAEEVALKGDRPLRYTYTQSQVDENGDATFYQNKIQMAFTSAGKTEKDNEDFNPATVVAPMVQSLLQKRWDDLMKGDTVKVRYLSIERLETIGFKFYKDSERDYKGKPAVDVLMKPSSFLIAALVSPIRITLQKEAPHWILESDGRLPIRWPKRVPALNRDDWKAIDARVEYDIPTAVPEPKPLSPLPPLTMPVPPAPSPSPVK